jgi:hypothetical protein
MDRPEGLWSLWLAGTPMPAWILHAYFAEEGLYGCRSRVFDLMSLAAIGAWTPPLQILVDLLRDHAVLDA